MTVPWLHTATISICNVIHETRKSSTESIFCLKDKCNLPIRADWLDAVQWAQLGSHHFSSHDFLHSRNAGGFKPPQAVTVQPTLVQKVCKLTGVFKPLIHPLTYNGKQPTLNRWAWHMGKLAEN